MKMIEPQIARPQDYQAMAAQTMDRVNAHVRKLRLIVADTLSEAQDAQRQ